jgi:hypothetical protein
VTTCGGAVALRAGHLDPNITDAKPWPTGCGFFLCRSEAVVLFPQRVLVGIARLLGFQFRVVKLETGVVPMFHRDHGVIVCRQGLFCADCFNLAIHRRLVVLEKLIEINVLHESELRLAGEYRQRAAPTIHERFMARGSAIRNEGGRGPQGPGRAVK